MRKIGFFGLLFIVAVFTLAQTKPLSQLTVEEIMQAPEKFIGTSPSRISWSKDSKSIFFYWDPDGNGEVSAFKVSKDGGTPEKADDTSEGWPSSYEYNKAKTKIVYAEGGDIYIKELKSGTVTRLTATNTRENSPSFHKENVISFMADDNLFTINTETGLMTQLTNFVINNGNDGDGEIFAHVLDDHVRGGAPAADRRVAIGQGKAVGRQFIGALHHIEIGNGRAVEPVAAVGAHPLQVLLQRGSKRLLAAGGLVLDLAAQMRIAASVDPKSGGALGLVFEEVVGNHFEQALGAYDAGLRDAVGARRKRASTKGKGGRRAKSGKGLATGEFEAVLVHAASVCGRPCGKSTSLRLHGGQHALGSRNARHRPLARRPCCRPAAVRGLHAVEADGEHEECRAHGGAGGDCGGQCHDLDRAHR